jgi:hypothetical protein
MSAFIGQGGIAEPDDTAAAMRQMRPIARSPAMTRNLRTGCVISDRTADIIIAVVTPSGPATSSFRHVLDQRLRAVRGREPRLHRRRWARVPHASARQEQRGRRPVYLDWLCASMLWSIVDFPAGYLTCHLKHRL